MLTIIGFLKVLMHQNLALRAGAGSYRLVLTWPASLKVLAC
jgi:hypothetical protein